MSSQLSGSNDKYIKELIKHPNYKFFKNGKILKYFKKCGANTKLRWNRVYFGTSSSGYNVITYKNKKLAVHRVIFAYFNKIDQRKVINHKNHVKKYNRLSNLELVTFQQNSLHSYIKRKNKSSNINLSIANQIRKLNNNGWEIKAICDKFNVSKFIVRRILKNETWCLNKNITNRYKTNFTASKILRLFVKDENYVISKKGLIFSKKSGKLILLKVHRYGKMKQISYKGRKLSIHRIIATKFLGPIPKKYVVNHLDGNQSNNRVSNLKIVSQKDNMIHSSRILKKNPKDIYSKEIKKNGD